MDLMEIAVAITVMIGVMSITAVAVITDTDLFPTHCFQVIEESRETPEAICMPNY